MCETDALKESIWLVLEMCKIPHTIE